MRNLENTIDTKVHELIGKKCWDVVARDGSAIISVYLGEKLLPKNQNASQNNSVEGEIEYEAEYSLFVECVWRLDSIDKVICGAWDEDHKMLEGLNRIIESEVTRIELSKPAMDLTVEFSSSLKLKIFCDQTNIKDKRDNYSLFTSSDIFTIGSKSKLQSELRDPKHESSKQSY